MSAMLLTYFLMLASALFSPANSGEVITECIEPAVVEYSIAQQFSREQFAVCLEYNTDLRTPATNPSVVQRESSSQSVSRHRVGSQDRVSLCKDIVSHQGHTTHVLEYDKVKSSLRKAYYLHTLCRLRI